MVSYETCVPPPEGNFLFAPLPYDPADRESCLRHAGKLKEAGSLRQAIHDCVPPEHQPTVIREVDAILSSGGRGPLGMPSRLGISIIVPTLQQSLTLAGQS